MTMGSIMKYIGDFASTKAVMVSNDAAQKTMTKPARKADSDNTKTDGTAGAPPTAAAPPTDAAKEAADRFLTLLVTQLRNQDPMNPMDNAQVTTQLAQISTVSGINQLNDTVASLSASFAAGQYLQAAALVGREVVVASDKVSLGEDGAAYGLAIASDAEAVQITIKDAAGVIVRTIDLGAQESGIRNFAWDGMDNDGSALPEGDYKISVTATTKGTAVAVDPLAVAQVSGIAPTAQGTVLMLGELGTFALTDILQIN